LLKLQTGVFKIIFTGLVKIIFFHFLSNRNSLDLNLTGLKNLVGFGFINQTLSHKNHQNYENEIFGITGDYFPDVAEFEGSG
jgi:hypothetical protein